MEKSIWMLLFAVVGCGVAATSVRAQGFEYVPPPAEAHEAVLAAAGAPSTRIGADAPVAPAPREVALSEMLDPGQVHGFGKGIPLEKALFQIVPGDVVVSYDHRVDRNLAVDWRGGAEWQTVVEEIARVNGLQMARVGRQLIVAPAGVLILDLREGEEPAWATPGAAVRPRGQERSDEDAVSLVRRKLLWEAPAGKTLREVLESWAEADPEWRVRWEASATYPLAVSHTFEGSFEEAATELLTAFEFAQPRLVPFKSANRVFVIQNVDQKGSGR